jgi:hypothetical protein
VDLQEIRLGFERGRLAVAEVRNHERERRNEQHPVLDQVGSEVGHALGVPREVRGLGVVRVGEVVAVVQDAKGRGAAPERADRESVESDDARAERFGEDERDTGDSGEDNAVRA